MSAPRTIVVNALCAGSAGIATVARELTRHLAVGRPAWVFTLVITEGHALQEAIAAQVVGPNVRVERAPAATAGRVARARWERASLPAVAARVGAGALLQLNGMVVPTVRLPTLAHFGDPWPYTPAAWTHARHRVVAWVKRRENARALRSADACGFTSGYLRDLVTGHLGVAPTVADVFYNGVPRAWIDRAASPDLPPLDGRPMTIVSVSNVSPYKRQGLVINAMPSLIARPGLASLTYRVVGECDEAYCAELREKVDRLGLAGRVTIEGRVSDATVQEAFASARAFVLPSVCESFCIPAIEAMSFGTPVVVADAGALPEVVGDAGERCRPDDLADLTDKLARVLTVPDHAAALRRRGAERVARYDWADTAGRVAERLEAICRR